MKPIFYAGGTLPAMPERRVGEDLLPGLLLYPHQQRAMETLFGMTVRGSEYATETVTVIKPWPRKKRRRGWQVVKEARPCVFIVQGNMMPGMRFGKTIIAHPEVLAKIRLEADKYRK